MKQRELTNEVISASTQREAVLDALEEAFRTAYASASKRGLFGTPNAKKIEAKFKTEFEKNVVVALEQDVPEIKTVKWVDLGPTTNAAVVQQTQELEISTRFSTAMADWVEHFAEQGVTDVDQMIKGAWKLIDYMAEILIHELVHLIQVQREPRQEKDYRSYLAKTNDQFVDAMDNLGDPENFQIYLASPQEIPAHAHQMVYRLVSQALGGKSANQVPADEIPYVIQELKDTLKDVASGMSANDETLASYLDFRGPDPRKTKVFQRFMKQVYQEVQSYITMLQQRQQQPLRESFDNPFKWRQTDDGQQVVYEFSTDKLSYAVVFDNQDDMGYELMFASDKGGANYGITGTGDAFRVFATVGVILKRFIKDYKPNQIFFSAEEPSRIKLYDRLATLMPRLGLQPVTPQEHGHYVFRRGRKKTQPSVTESFDNPYEFKKTARYDRVFYHWMTDDERECVCQIRLEDSDLNTWGLMFAVNGETKQTGGGDAARILATVINCFRDWLANEGKDAHGISFAGDLSEPSRIKLYDRFAKMMPKFGFRDIKSNFQLGNSKFYEFERIKPLNETFDRAADYRWLSQDDEEGKATFEIAGTHYVFYYSRYPVNPLETDPDGNYFPQGSKKLDISFMDFERGHGITGRGHAQEVFATVIALTKEVLAKFPNENIITFSAEEPSRQKLYAALIKRLLPSWDVKRSARGKDFYCIRSEKLNETLNSPYKWKEQDSYNEDVVYKFQTEDDTFYEVTFVGKGSDRYIIEFSARDDDYNIHFDVTGSGDAFRVFATVGDILKQFVSKYKPTLLTFSALEKSRIKLYDRLAKLIQGLGFEQQPTIGGRGYYAFKTNKPNAVTESFDSPVVAKWQEMYPSGGYAKFTVGDANFMYAYDTKPEEDEVPREIWIGFEDDNRGMGITGTGHAYQVFATVIDLTRQVVAKFPTIERLTFSSAEQSRSKLYQRMAKTLLPDWTVEQKKSTAAGSTMFTLSRPSQVTETFNSAVPYEWRGDQAYFTINDNEYRYDYRFNEALKRLSISFGLQDDVEGTVYDITGTGNAQQIFSTVTTITRELVEKLKPDTILFSAAEKSRRKLYTHMAKRLLPDWSMSMSGGGRVFVLKRPGAPEQIAETFDKPLAWRKRTASWGLVYFFDTPEGKRVDVSVSINSMGVAEIIFEVDGTVERTGRGEAMAIFATVIDCVKNALGDPTMDRAWKIQYGADKYDTSRQKLYSRFAKILPRAGYEFVGTHDTNLYKEFEFVNPEKEKKFGPKKPELIPPEEQIEETFNTPVDYNWISMGNDVGRANFTVGDVTYLFVYQSLMKTKEGSPLWVNIMFNDTAKKAKGKGFGVTGSGNAAQVFATAVQLIRDVLEKFPSITKIKFTAKEKSRRDLYVRMVNRLLPDWEMNTKKESGALAFTVSKPLNESASGGATCSGSIAPVARPLGGVIRRSGSSILSGINTAEPTPNTPDWMLTYKRKSQNKKRSK